MASFQDKWAAPQKQSFMDKLGDTLKPKGSLKPRVEMAVKRLQAQIGKLDGMCQKLQERDQKIFQKIVAAQQAHDTYSCLLYTSPSPRDQRGARLPADA